MKGGGQGLEWRGQGFKIKGSVEPTAVAVSAVAFLAITVTCVATALLAMIALEIRVCNHDKRQNDDRQDYDADEVHFQKLRVNSEK